MNLLSRIAENVDRFTGRAWLLPEVLTWFEEAPDQRLFLITGSLRRRGVLSGTPQSAVPRRAFIYSRSVRSTGTPDWPVRMAGNGPGPFRN